MNIENKRINRGNERGMAAVEFGLLLVFIIFPLIVGLIDFGHLFKHKQVINNAAREGVRAAVKGDDLSSISSKITTYYNNEIRPADRFTLTIDPPIYNPNKVIGAEVTVTVIENDFKLLINPGSIFPNIDKLTAIAIMRYQ